MNNKSEERSHKQIMKCVKELSEGYDTVQIFLTRHVDINKNIEDTESLYFGLGNKFAIYGQIKNWLLTEERKMINIADIEFDSEFGEADEDDDDGTEEKE
jgi:hypothetical protein